MPDEHALWHFVLELLPWRGDGPDPGPACRVRRALKHLLRFHGIRARLREAPPDSGETPLDAPPPPSV